MTELQRADLLDQILADPDDLSLRKKWAKAWEHDDPEFARFIDLDLRFSHAMRRVPHPTELYDYDADRHALRLERDRMLRDGVLERLLGAEPRPLTHPRVQDGFVAGGRVVADDLTRAPDNLFGRYPVRHLAVADARPHIERLARLPLMTRVRTLSLVGCGLDDNDLTTLLASPHLDGLRMLDLRDNALTEDAAVALAQAEGLGALQVVRLGGNPCPNLEIDPWVDQGHVIGWTEAPLAIDLRARFGSLPWLEPANTLVTDPACF
jgi:hypothetical protein